MFDNEKHREREIKVLKQSMGEEIKGRNTTKEI